MHVAFSERGGDALSAHRRNIVSNKRTLQDDEIIACTGARVATEPQGSQDTGRYEVQLESQWVEVDHASYERVRQIQDSCA